jgi:hypothetical protein
MKKILLISVIMLFTVSLVFAQWQIDEGFEGGAIPTDWAVFDADGDGLGWAAYQNSSYAHSGEWMASVVAYSSSDGHDWLVTPQVTVQSGDSFTFWARSWYDTEDFNVWVSTSNSSDTSFEWYGTKLEEITGVGETYVEYSYDLSAYAGQDVYLGIEWNIDNYSLLVDDVKVGQDAVTAPDAPVATAATTDGTLTFSANWNASTEATGYYLDVATDIGFTTFLAGYENLDVGNVTTYSVTVTSAVSHYYRLRAYNAGGTSGNSNVITVNDSSLPVTLSNFTGVFANNSPVLQWETKSEDNNSGWNLYRGNNETDFDQNVTLKINNELIEGAGTTSEPSNYNYTDIYEVEPGNTYWYWLESVANNGETETYGPITLNIPEEQETPELPQITKLIGNYPNPFNPQTTIEFQIKAGDTGKLTIYNSKGQVVETETLTPEQKQFIWEASRYGSGIYFYKLETENYSDIKKMILLK